MNQPTQLVVRRRKKLPADQPDPWLFSLGQSEGSSSIAWLARTVRQAHIDRPSFVPQTRVDCCGELQWITLLDLDDWEAVVKTAWIAIVGGAESKHAECGLELPFLALYAPTEGIPVLGVQNSALRLCLGVSDLLPPDRPDLLCEAIEQLTQRPEDRQKLHFSVVRHWQNTHTENLLRRVRTDLFRKLFEKHDDNG